MWWVWYSPGRLGWEGDQAGWEGDQEGDQAGWEGDQAGWEGDQAGWEGDQAGWEGDQVGWEGDQEGDMQGWVGPMSWIPNTITRNSYQTFRASASKEGALCHQRRLVHHGLQRSGHILDTIELLSMLWLER